VESSCLTEVDTNRRSETGALACAAVTAAITAARCQLVRGAEGGDPRRQASRAPRLRYGAARPPQRLCICVATWDSLLQEKFFFYPR